MRRKHSEFIQVPTMLDGDVLSENGELNLRQWNYAERVKKQTIDHYILSPFRRAAKEVAKKAAVENERPFLYQFGDSNATLQVVVDEQEKRRNAHDSFRRMKRYLDDIVTDSQRGVVRHGVRKGENGAYIEVAVLLDKYAKTRKGIQTPTETVKLAGPDGRDLKADRLVRELEVVYDQSRYGRVQLDSFAWFVSGWHLAANLTAFSKAYKTCVLDCFGIPRNDLDSQREECFEMSDGSPVRFLFFPHKRIEYSAILSRIYERMKDGPARSNGDLHVLADLAFKAPYTTKAGGWNFSVHTQSGGEVIIDRSARGKTDLINYHTMMQDNRLFVHAEDVITTMNLLQARETKVPTTLTITFGVKPPLNQV